MKTKEEMRKLHVRRRASMDADDAAKKSSAIAKLVFTSDLLANAQNVLCYIAVGNEVQTRGVIERLLKQKKEVSVPAFDEKTQAYIPVVFTGWHTLSRKPKRPPEPTVRMPVHPLSLHAAIIPGVAFDRKGNRVGFGGGNYDALLTPLPKTCVKIGLAFAWQIVETLPREPHDVAVDSVVTEKGVLTFSSS